MVRMHCPCLWTVGVSCRREICHLCAISEAPPRCPCAQKLLDPWRCPLPPHRPPQGIVHPTRHHPYGPDPPDDLDARVTTQPNVLSLDADFSLGMPLAKVDGPFFFFVVFSNHPCPAASRRQNGQRPRRHPTGSRRYPFHRHIAACPLDPSALGVASLLPLSRSRCPLSDGLARTLRHRAISSRRAVRAHTRMRPWRCSPFALTTLRSPTRRSRRGRCPSHARTRLRCSLHSCRQ